MRLPTDPESDRPTEINIVALTDIMFAILTFFIAISLTLTTDRGLPVNLPTAGTSQSQTPTKIVVSLDSTGALAIDRRSVTLDNLVPQLQSLLAKSPQSLVVLNADERIAHGRVVAIMDRVRQIPGVKLAIATKLPQ
jgi:biopolymer transport protein ExbD